MTHVVAYDHKTYGDDAPTTRYLNRKFKGVQIVRYAAVVSQERAEAVAAKANGKSYGAPYDFVTGSFRAVPLAEASAVKRTVDTGPKLTKAQCAQLWKMADLAGRRAAEATIPVPMVVSQHANALDDHSSVIQAWYVADGACGFGWVQVYPGNGSFAHWLKANGHGRADNYAGGVHAGSPLRTQSLERNAAWAQAAATVLSEAGIKAYGRSRID